MPCNLNRRKAYAFCLLCCGLVFSLPLKAGNEASERGAVLSEQQDSKHIRVVGVVKDATGETAIGATVLVKGTTQGVITDVEGNYIINAPVDGVLVFSYIGSKPQEIKINNRTVIDVTFESDAQMLEEFVAVGYGSQRKISTIGAQSGVKFVTDLKQPVATLSSVLAGRIAGVIGMQRTGEAGRDDNTQIWIRGTATTTSSKPLVLVDGIERSFSNIDPEDIASFQVLKDASATAVYGVKGANGVILIETKKGVKGKPRIKVEYTTGITNFTKLPELADGITYLQMANEAAMNKGRTPVYSEEYIRNTRTQSDPMLYPNVNWFKEIFKDHGTNQRININTNGGSEFAQYYVSLGYYTEGGLYNTVKSEPYDGSMDFNRFNFVSNLTMQVTKTTEVDLGIQGEISDYNTPYYSAEDIFGTILRAYPTLFAVSYPDNKTPYINNGGGVKNPYAMVHRMGTNKRNTSETRANIAVKQKLGFFLEGLSARMLAGYDSYTRNDVIRSGNPITYQATGRNGRGDLVLQRTDNMAGSDTWGYNKNSWGHRQYYFEGALNYDQTFDEKHRVGGLLLYNMTDYLNVTAGKLYHAIPFKSMGVAGRGTYSYDDRYFSEVNFGYNGAENFRPGKKFGFFPSVGFAWVPSNEKFFKPMEDYLQFLKLRFSWGKAGNSQLDNAAKGESNQRFVWIETIKDSDGFNFSGDRNNSAYGSGLKVGLPGVDVTWETSTKSNLGVDFNLWNNDLSFQVDFFREKRENIFLQRASVPGYIGIPSEDLPYGNFGKVENKGFEVSSDLNKTFGKVNVLFQGNISFNKNKWIEDDSPIKPYEWQNSAGKSLNIRYGYTALGYYTQEDIDNPDVAKPLSVSVKPGDLRYKDLNEDGVIDSYDQGYIGKPSIPRLTYGFGTTVSWNNFTLGMFFQGVSDVSLTLSASGFKPFADESAKGNLYANITDRWTEENPRQDAFWPRLDYGLTNAMNYEESTHWIKDGSYLRLKTLDLAYNIPNKLTKKYGLNSCRVYVSCFNVMTFSSFDLWDVELGQDNNGMKYPNLRTYALGVNFSF